MKIASLVLITLLLGASCTIEEHYHFNKDLSGTYEMNVNFGEYMDELGDQDFTKEMESSMVQVKKQLKNVQGISKIKSKGGKEEIKITYRFDGIAALNRAENVDSEHEFREIVNLTDRKFTFTGDTDEIKNAASDGKEAPESDEMLDKLLKYKVKLTFDTEFPVAQMEGFKQMDAKTFEYSSEVSGLDKAPILQLDLK